MKKDSRLLELVAHEQAISHRIAYYLENQFYKKQKLNVDCEYNKYLITDKEVNIDLTEYKSADFKNCGCRECKKAKTF